MKKLSIVAVVLLSGLLATAACSSDDARDGGENDGDGDGTTAPDGGASDAGASSEDAASGDDDASAEAGGALFVNDCDSICAAATALSCPAGAAAPCSVACPYLNTICTDPMTAYFACTNGKEHTSSNTTCEPVGGLVLHDDCMTEAQAVIDCSSGG